MHGSFSKGRVIAVEIKGDGDVELPDQRRKKDEDEADRRTRIITSTARDQVELLHKLRRRPKSRRGWWGFVKELLLNANAELRVGGVLMEDWMHTGWGPAIISLNYSLFLVAWLYFVVVLTKAGMTTKFLSLEDDPVKLDCDEVPTKLTLTVQGDVYGRWSTDALYQQNMSVFELQFSGSNITNEQFIGTMQSFSAKLRALGAKSARRDAGWNAMMWSTWAFVDAESQMSFQSTADANIIYDAPIQMGVLTSADAGMCANAAQSGYYDAANNALAFTVPTPPVSNTTLAGYPVPAPRGAYMADYINSTWENADACPRQYPALEWRSWEPSVLTNTLVIGFDMRAAVTAMALNLNIINFDSLVVTKPAFGARSVGGIPGLWWVNPFYLPHAPIFCVDLGAVRARGILPLTDAQVHGPPVCFLVEQAVNNKKAPLAPSLPLFYYPFTLSMYLDAAAAPRHCTCPNDINVEDCNARNYLVSFFYDMDRTDSTKPLRFALQLQRFLVDDPVDGDVKMQRFLFPFLASVWMISAPGGVPFKDFPSVFNSTLTGQQYHMRQWRRVCPWGTCAAVAFNSVLGATLAAFLPINRYYFQSRNSPLLNATYGTPPNVEPREMCANTLYSPAAMASFIKNAPLPLVQPYFECSKKTWPAFQEAAGNAAGIAGGIASTGLLVLGFLFKFVQNQRARRQKIPHQVNGDGASARPGKTARVGDPRFSLDSDDEDDGVPQLAPSLLAATRRERVEGRLDDAKEEALLDVIEGLMQNAERNHQLLQQLLQQQQQQQQAPAGGGGGASGGDLDLDRGTQLVDEQRAGLGRCQAHLDHFKVLCDFDLKEAQLLSVLAEPKR